MEAGMGMSERLPWQVLHTSLLMMIMEITVRLA
jgi:hypothetical protein